MGEPNNFVISSVPGDKSNSSRPPISAFGMVRHLAVNLNREGVPSEERERRVRAVASVHKLDEQDVKEILADKSLSFKEWPEAKPLNPPTPPAPRLTKDMLPGMLADYVEEISQQLSNPLDMAAGVALTMIGSAAGRSIQIRPQTGNPKWTLPANLWCVIIASSGFGKSPTISSVLRPLEACQENYQAQFDEAMQTWNEQMRVYEIQKKSASKTGEDPGPPPLAPTLTRLSTNSSSWEALHEIMGENPTGVLLVTDEVVKLWEYLDAPSNSQAKGFFLQSWNGNDTFTVDRVTRGKNLRAIVCLSQIGGAQPDLMRRYVRSMSGDGWLQRYGLLLYPDLNMPYEVCKDLNERYYQPMEDLIRKLVGIRDDFEQHDRVLPFSAQAQPLYDSWLTALVNRQRTSNEHDAIVSHFSKYRSLMAQLALVFEVVQNPDAQEISVGSTELALRWVTGYLDEHAKRVYGLAVPGGDSSPEYALAQALKQRELESPFTARDVQRKNWHALTTNADVQEACDMLMARGWIRTVDSEKAPGRPTTRYEANPRLP